MIDTLRISSNRLDWCRIDADLPPGIHEPKKHGDIGWDMEAMITQTLEPGEGIDCPVNAMLALPRGVYADVRNRSSMARRGLHVDANLIDTGYRGPLFVFLRNMNTQPIEICQGERIGQLVFHRASPLWINEIHVNSFDSNTERGATGWGSTGR